MPTTLHVGSIRPKSGSVEAGRQVWTVGKRFDLICEWPHTTIHLGADPGQETDLNSVPRFFNRIAPPQNYPASAVLHDQQCVSKEVPSYVAASIYHWTLRMEGCSAWGAFLRWFAVRFFGPQFKGKPFGTKLTEAAE